MKYIIDQIYNSLKHENFIYYLKEIEFRYNVRNKNSSGKIKEIQNIIEYCYSTCKLNFVNKDILIDYDKEIYISSEDEEEYNEDDD